MIQITLLKENGKYKELHTKGHALFGDYGTDIVCASVSILVINTLNSIEKFTNDKFEEKAEQESGRIDFVFKSVPSEQSNLLLDSLVFGLKAISSQYGDKYLKINIQEV
ncbi:MAG: ribosomal-processing cysteine protease Prp [Lachnospiraceae bacterium]|nr:ribosomal-processing cysteine protease Prp [Lachnospiraceae bacterium]